MNIEGQELFFFQELPDGRKLYVTGEQLDYVKTLPDGRKVYASRQPPVTEELLQDFNNIMRKWQDAVNEFAWGRGNKEQVLFRENREEFKRLASVRVTLQRVLDDPQFTGDRNRLEEFLKKTDQPIPPPPRPVYAHVHPETREVHYRYEP